MDREWFRVRPQREACPRGMTASLRQPALRISPQREFGVELAFRQQLSRRGAEGLQALDKRMAAARARAPLGHREQQGRQEAVPPGVRHVEQRAAQLMNVFPVECSSAATLRARTAGPATWRSASQAASTVTSSPLSMASSDTSHVA